jgi:CubicO group peptidase (beta-lactamase class C family)
VVLAAERVPADTWMAYADPEEAGFSVEKLAEAREYWESIRSSAVLVVYDGAVLVNWGETARRFRCHSVRKSFMSGMYGIYLDAGKIDKTKTMADLGIDDEPRLTDEEKTARIQDLLAARSGVYRLAAYEPPQNPKPERGTHPPGTHWVYNNWDFNTLVTIFEQETGRKFFEDFDARFAKPLGFQDYDPAHGYYHYEKEKSIHPAYPFRMSARDMARFGLLYLHRGKWGKKRILSEAYIDESTAWISDTQDGGYGYMWWLAGDERLKPLGLYSALGVGGQSIDVMPGANMVFVNRADTYEGGSVSQSERYALIKMILDARVGDPKKKPRLVPVGDPEPAYEPVTLTAAQMEPYVLEQPIPNPGGSVKIWDDGGRLMIEFGEGPIPFHNVAPDHFVIEDHNEHVYFEDGEDGAKTLIAADLLLMEARQRIQFQDRDGALERLAKAEEYFPEDPRVFTTVARIHMQQASRSIEQAIQQFEKVEELRPDRTLDKSPLAWGLMKVQARLNPPDTSGIERFAGSYGARQVTYEDGKLLYSRDGNEPVELIPLTENLFQHSGVEWFRVRFDTGADGRVFRITGFYQDGNRDESLRD